MKRLVSGKRVLGGILAVTILPALAAYSQSAGIPIEHFIFIIQENHSFDNYFGTWTYYSGRNPQIETGWNPLSGFRDHLQRLGKNYDLTSHLGSTADFFKNIQQHTSPLALLEIKYGLPALTKRDGSSNSMLDCFDFSQTPLPFYIITR